MTRLMYQFHVVNRVGATLVEPTNVVDLAFVEVVGQLLRTEKVIAALTLRQLSPAALGSCFRRFTSSAPIAFSAKVGRASAWY